MSLAREICGIWRHPCHRSPPVSLGNRRADLRFLVCSPNGVRTRVSTLRVFSEPISLPAAMPESGSRPAGSTLQLFPSFLDVSRSFAGRMRDKRGQALRA